MHSHVRHLIETVDLGQLPELARHLVTDRTTREVALHNTTLPHTQVAHLLRTAVTGKGKLTAAELTRIASLELDSDDVDVFIDKVRATGALQTLVGSQTLTDDQLATLATAGSHVKGGVVEALLRAGASPDQLADASVRTGGIVQLRWMAQATPASLPDETAAEMVATLDGWMPSPKRGMGDLLRLVLRRGGDVLAAAVTAPSSTVRSVAAGMRELTAEQAWSLAGLVRFRDAWHIDPEVGAAAHEYVWLGLVNNPVCPADVLDAISEAFASAVDAPYKAVDSLSMRRSYKPAPVTVPFEQVDDAKQLDWVVRRATKRPVDLAAVAANPHLSDPQASTLLQAAANLPAVLHDEARATVEALTERVDGGERPAWLDGIVSPEMPEPYDDRRFEAAQVERERVPMDAAMFRDRPVASMRYAPGATARFAVELGDDPAAWSTLFDLIGGWDGTLGELADTVQALAGA